MVTTSKPIGVAKAVVAPKKKSVLVLTVDKKQRKESKEQKDKRMSKLKLREAKELAKRRKLAKLIPPSMLWLSKSKPDDKLEDHLQSAEISWLEIYHPGIRRVTTCDIAGIGLDAVKRKATVNGRLKGWPDLTIAYPRGPFCGLFVENKGTEREADDHQKVVHRDLRLQGYCVRVICSLQAFIDLVTWYKSLGPHKTVTVV